MPTIFANERADRERIQTDREAQKERLKEFEREIALLKEQVDIVDFTIDQSAAFNLAD